MFSQRSRDPGGWSTCRASLRPIGQESETAKQLLHHKTNWNSFFSTYSVIRKTGCTFSWQFFHIWNVTFFPLKILQCKHFHLLCHNTALLLVELSSLRWNGGDCSELFCRQILPSFEAWLCNAFCVRLGCLLRLHELHWFCTCSSYLGACTIDSADRTAL